MTKMSKTKVIFKVIMGQDLEVIALFPELAGDNNPYKTCLSYAHIGQHSAASIELASSLKPALLSQYYPLYRELTMNCGYELQVVKKFSRKMLQARIMQCEV